MSFSLKHARYFVAAARTGQVSRAAIELNVSQSAVTSAIHQLETIIGVTLFERRHSGVTLTPAGARFLKHAEHIVAAVTEATRVAVEPPREGDQVVRIGMTYTVSGYFAAPLICRVRRLFPDLKIVLEEAGRRQIENGLLDEKLDLAIMLTSNLENADLIAHETLVRSQRRLWMPAEHPLARRRTVSLSDLAGEPYIGLTVDEAMDTQRRYWLKANVQPNVVFETSSVEAVRTMVAAGMGVTVLSDMVYRPWSLEGQRIDTCDLTDDVPSMDVGVAWKAPRTRSGSVLALIDFLKTGAGYDARIPRNAKVPAERDGAGLLARL